MADYRGACQVADCRGLIIRLNSRRFTGRHLQIETRPTLLLATSNADEIREFRLIFGDRVDLLAPVDLGLDLKVDEAGSSYTMNARSRAEAYFAATQVPTIGEDSGLEIDALSETSVLHRAHFERLSDGATTNAHVLELLAALPPPRRTCHYRCTIVFKPTAEEEHVFHGICSGYVVQAPAGTGGFSFDPIVRLSGLNRTVAELTDEERIAVTHRARAARKLLRFLRV